MSEQYHCLAFYTLAKVKEFKNEDLEFTKLYTCYNRTKRTFFIYLNP